MVFGAVTAWLPLGVSTSLYHRTPLQSCYHQLAHPHALLVTVHSLCRSSAQECARKGAPQDQLMRHGTWASTAINSYVPRRLYATIPSQWTVLGQLPLGQLPLGQLPCGQLPRGHLPCRTITPIGQLPRGQLHPRTATPRDIYPQDNYPYRKTTPIGRTITPQDNYPHLRNIIFS